MDGSQHTHHRLLGLELRPPHQRSEQERGVSVIQMHGEDDQAVPYHGGQSSMLDVRFQSALETVLQWVRHDGLNNVPVEGNLQAGIRTYVFSEPGNPYEVRLYCFENVDHNVGVLEYVTSLRSYEDILDFFEDHPKPS